LGLGFSVTHFRALFFFWRQQSALGRGWNFSSHELTCASVAILGHFFIPPFWAEIAKFLAFCCRDWTPLCLGQFSSPINLPAQVLQFWVTFLFSQ
jgi:glucose-6-phosphate-specific signal transduction histidine kinase